MILDNSKKTFVSIENEQEFLQLYLTLEAMRLNNNLQFSIKISDEIIANEDKLPPMLLQPIIENSIKHGYSPQKAKLKIDIDIDANEAQIICSITDNGIGRENSRKLKQFNYPNHKSHATNIIIDRLNLLSKIFKKEHYFEIIDLYNNFEEPIGTKVNIYLNRNNELQHA
jgi:LytS/YehU family sensor histidine kinase